MNTHKPSKTPRCPKCRSKNWYSYFEEKKLKKEYCLDCNYEEVFT